MNADKPNSYDKERVHFNLARLKSHGHKFEVVIDPDKAMAYKQGAALTLRDVLMSDHIFFDAHKGLHAGEDEMRTVFNTIDHLKIAEQIIQKGEVQLTAEFREGVREERRKSLVYLIHRNAVDPRTKLPHPVIRIERAMEEAKVRIDENRRPEDQVQDVVRALQPILPIKFEIIKLEVHLPAQHASKSYHVLKNFGSVLSDKWNPDGSMSATLEMPAGLQDEFFDAINKATHGSVETKVVGTR